MEKLAMCRICLLDNSRMFMVTDKNLQETYEKLTNVPFVTEDSRPMLACFVCFTKLQQSYQLQRKCLEAEELFAQMMNKYELKPVTNRGHSEFVTGFVKTSTENISTVNDDQTNSGAIEIEVPAVSEKQCDIVEIKVERQSDELEPEYLDNSYPDVANIPPYHLESELDDDVPLTEFKTEVLEEAEEQEISKTKLRAKNTKRTTVAKKPKLDRRRTILEDVITAEQTEKSDLEVIRTIQSPTSKPRTYFKMYNLTKPICIHTDEKPFKCNVCQRSFSKKSNLTDHIRMHTGEKPFKCDICQCSFRQNSHLTTHMRQHTGEKPYKCDVCQRSFRKNDHLRNHIRVHTGEKPYKCNVCTRRFCNKSDLTKHIRIHTGEKLYV